MGSAQGLLAPADGVMCVYLFVCVRVHVCAHVRVRVSNPSQC